MVSLEAVQMEALAHQALRDGSMGERTAHLLTSSPLIPEPDSQQTVSKQMILFQRKQMILFQRLTVC